MKQRFDISGMTCSACQANVKKAAEKAGATDVVVNLITESMSLNYDDSKISSDDIIRAVADIGYSASIKGSEKEKIEDTSTKEMSTSTRLKISIALTIPLLYISMGHMIGLGLPEFMNHNEGAINNAFIQFLLTIPVLFVNRKFFISGFKGLAHRAYNMDTLVALGASAATFYGIYAIIKMSYGLGSGDIETFNQYRTNIYFEAAAVIVTLITLGKHFEDRSKKDTKKSLEKLINLAPKTATVIEDGKEVSRDVKDLKVGDIILIKPGDSIPVDGEIIEGSSLIDQAAITGESIPVSASVGDQVISASINTKGSFKFRAQRVGEDTTLSQIINLVNEANESKAPIAKLVDKVSSIFVPIVIVISILTFIVWNLLGYGFEFALNMAIAVLVISCPCALGLATPMAIMVSTGKSAELNLLFKNAESLENLHKVDTILLDKTGTITEGKPQVTDIKTSLNEDEFIKIAASIEKDSEHPLSRAILAYAKDKGISLEDSTDFENLTGLGIRARLFGKTYLAGNKKLMDENNLDIKSFEEDSLTFSKEGKTSMYFADDKEVIGIIAVADKAKKDSKEAIKNLKEMGYEVSMVTGDNELTAEAIRKELDIDKKFAEVMPQDKDKVVSKLQKMGKKVSMVGDGINDAPALARSDVAMAIGSGTDIAIDSADVILMRDSLMDIVSCIKLSKKTLRVIKENLFWAFIYNIILIPVAAGVLFPSFGIRLNPMFAAAAMSLSSVFVCLNSLRLRNFDTNREDEIDHSLDQPIIENKIMEENMSDLNKMVVNVDGMSCENCAKHVTKALKEISGIEDVDVSLDNHLANVSYFGSINEDEVEKAIADAGYEYKGIEYK